MKELVVISGKGGTGKTSLVASFAALEDLSCVITTGGVPQPALAEVRAAGVEVRVV